MSETNKNKIPKKIWMLWLQGWDEAPESVIECYKSWKNLNPNWEVIQLTKHNLKNYINVEKFLNNEKLPPQAKSNIIRIALMKEHGGVWTDATVYCAHPLEDWLPEYTDINGFFAFEKPRYDKLISSWFFASIPNHPIPIIWLNEVLKYWTIGPIAPRFITKIWHMFLKICIKAKLSKFFVTNPMFFTKKYLGLFPYNWFHFIFGHEYSKNSELKMVWDNVPKLSATGPRVMLSVDLGRKKFQEEIKKIDLDKVPMHKLSWGVNLNSAEMQGSRTTKMIEATKEKYNFK
jgi:hypothetical protein